MLISFFSTFLKAIPSLLQKQNRKKKEKKRGLFLFVVLKVLD